MRIGLVTSAVFPRPEWRDSDSPLVQRHLYAKLVPWDADTGQDWTRFDALILQSPWSMWENLDGFARWLDDRQDTPMLNPPDVVRLGSNKRYLETIAGTVPTTFITDPRHDLATAFPAEQERRTIVVKPVAAGGSMGAREFRRDQLDEAVAYVESAEQQMLVQPYIQAIDTHRELGVLTLNGEISHAITKAPILKEGTDERAFHPDPRPYELTDAQRAVVRNTYQALFRNTAEPLSVRLDFIIDPAANNGLLLLEVEMVAPVKFFGLFPDECRRYAGAISARLG
jgi:glutathione synthase/RimK-type ligase-like ATP-grasp enzyme